MTHETIAHAAHPHDDAAFFALLRCLRVERERMRDAERRAGKEGGAR